MVFHVLLTTVAEAQQFADMWETARVERLNNEDQESLNHSFEHRPEQHEVGPKTKAKLTTKGIIEDCMKIR